MSCTSNSVTKAAWCGPSHTGGAGRVIGKADSERLHRAAFGFNGEIAAEVTR